MTKDAYFSLLTRTKQLLFVILCDTLAGIEVSFSDTRTDRRTDGGQTTEGQTDGEVKIAI